MMAYKISTSEAYMIWRKPIAACKNPVPIAESRLAEHQWSHQDIKVDSFTVHVGTLSACVGISICAEHVGCGTLSGDGVTKYIQNDANIQETQNLVEYNRFEVRNETEDQDQSIPKSIGTLTVLRCIFGLNLVSLTSFGIDLSPGQTHKPNMG